MRFPAVLFPARLLGALFCLAASCLPVSAAPRDVAMLDRILADVPSGQATVQLGDMIFPVSMLRAWRDSLAAPTKDGAGAQAAFAGGVNLWPGGVVPYTFGAGVDEAKQAAFADAANDWAAFARLTFVPRTTEANYITVNDGGPGLFGGNSAVGMIGGQQFINIGSTSWNRGTIAHEIGHALGLVHEHQRSDRDTFVDILTVNITPGAEGNFVLLPSSQNVGPYDFTSVMHYARNAFSTAPTTLNTIVPKPGFSQYLNVMGRGEDRLLSTADRAGMAFVYGQPSVAPGAVVRTTNDSGPGSLRAAIYYAIDHPGTTVTFAIPSSDPRFYDEFFRIEVTDRLPGLGAGTVLDASTQAQFTGDTNFFGPEVVLVGDFIQAPGAFADGISLREGQCTVRGLGIGLFGGAGIRISGAGATGNSIVGCYIGTEHRGAFPAPNNSAGVLIEQGAGANVIGGPAASDRNVIGGNANQGVLIRDSGTNGNSVLGNHIGVNAAGTGAVGNGWSGIEISGGAQGNTIGGLVTGAANVVGGNAFQGVFIGGIGTNGNVVRGNRIGTNAGGIAGVGNGWSGVEVSGGAQANVIGGTASGAGNLISRNQLQGVVLAGSGTTGNFIQGNRIGTNLTGTAALGNNFSGVEIFAAAQANTIGGLSDSARNVISGNGAGIYLSGTGTNTNLVQGNWIGTNATGTAAIANSGSGIGIFNRAGNNTIGGTIAGAGNVISGNASQGVLIGDSGTMGNIVQGNFVGVGPNGTALLPNGWSGVEIYGGAAANTIGGAAGGRNVIGGNANYGVLIGGAGSDGNIVRGNSIGVSASGGAAGNVWSGIAIFDGAIGTLIGGTAPGAANTIANNGLRGVDVIGTGTTGHAIRGNSIFANRGGIGLFNNGNNNRAKPVLTSATTSVGTAIAGTLTSAAGSTFQIDFFATNGPDAQGFYEGTTYLGSGSTNTDGFGNGAIAASLPVNVTAGRFITATATDPAGNTSDFSVGVPITIQDSDADGIADAWTQTYFFHPTGQAADRSRATDDADGDGAKNFEEFRAGTNPRSAASVLRIAALAKVGADLQFSLPSAPGVTYRIEAKDELSAATWTLWFDQMLGTGGVMTFTDFSGAGRPRRFYRATVQP